MNDPSELQPFESKFTGYILKMLLAGFGNIVALSVPYGR